MEELMQAPTVTNRDWYVNLVWLVGAAVLGFLIPSIFASLLRLSRSVFLIPYILLAGGFVFAFFHWSDTDWLNLFRHNWLFGLIGAALLAIFTVNNILSQPSSPTSAGLQLVIDLL
jgi:amino acid transporter